MFRGPKYYTPGVAAQFLDSGRLGVYHPNGVISPEVARRGRIRPQGNVLHERRRQAPGDADLVRARAPIRRHRRLQSRASVEHLPAEMPAAIAPRGDEAAGAGPG